MASGFPVLIFVLSVLQMRLSLGSVLSEKKSPGHDLTEITSRVNTNIASGSIVPCKMTQTSGGICAKPPVLGRTSCQFNMCARGFICGEEAAEEAERAFCEVKEVSDVYTCTAPFTELGDGCACEQTTQTSMACAYYDKACTSVTKLGNGYCSEGAGKCHKYIDQGSYPNCFPTPNYPPFTPPVVSSMEDCRDLCIAEAGCSHFRYDGTPGSASKCILLLVDECAFVANPNVPYVTQQVTREPCGP